MKIQNWEYMGEELQNIYKVQSSEWWLQGHDGQAVRWFQCFFFGLKLQFYSLSSGVFYMI